MPPTGLLGWKTRTMTTRRPSFAGLTRTSWPHITMCSFPDGRTVLLTLLCEGQTATVLQLPAQPATAAQADAQKRVTYVG